MKKYITYVGMDCGDKRHHVCVLDGEGEVIGRQVVRNSARDVQEALAEYPASLVAIEVGTHSRWLQRVIEEAGHKVLVANPRKLKAISSSDQKTDRNDAEMLARLARFDPKMLSPVVHRSPKRQMDLMILKSRDIVVTLRTSLINHVRGMLKSEGFRAPSSSADAFARKAAPSIPDGLKPALGPILDQIAQMTELIREYERKMAKLAEQYPEVEGFRQVGGVGLVLGLAYPLILEDPARFRKSRMVGAFVGLTPKQDQSGDIDKELRISKHGDAFLRRLLVSSAQYILGPLNKEDSALRRFGLRLAQGGGKRAKKRAVVAVARKLAVLLHRLWVTGEVYDPMRGVDVEEAA